jgi:putative tricarboxylic transport membrane protein
MNTMISFSNDWTVFFTRPISGTIVALTVIVLLLPFVQRLMRGVWGGFESGGKRRS